MQLTRRDVIEAAFIGAAAAAGGFWVKEGHANSGKYGDVFAELDRFVEQFMRDMNSPGMTLVLADRDGVQRVATYGYGDLDRQRQLKAEELFQIGSITKSFLGIVLLQLREEGKLDLHKPVVEYLPWFRIQSSFAPITTHHLLTHSSGLPGAPEVFPSDPAQRHIAAYAPGDQFHYNNMAYSLLGYLAWTLDGRELPEIFRERIFKPLGMSQSEPAIDFRMRGRMPRSYQPFLSDRPYPRHGELCEAPSIITTSGAGCIAATARDMGAYIQMIANRGRGPQRNLISAGKLRAVLEAAHQSRGIRPRRELRLRHRRRRARRQRTAATHRRHGVVHVGAAGRHLGRHRRFRFGQRTAGISSECCREVRAATHASACREQEAARRARAAIRNSRSPTPATTSVSSKASAVSWNSRPRARSWSSCATAGESRCSDRQRPTASYVDDPDLARFPLVFGRKKPDGPVVEVSNGDAWYATDAYDGPRQFQVPEAWRSYVGHYRSEDPWIGSLRVVVLKGRLMLDGLTPLELDGELFRLRDEPANTEWIRFGEVVNGKCMRLKFSGVDLWRVASA